MDSGCFRAAADDEHFGEALGRLEEDVEDFLED